MKFPVTLFFSCILILVTLNAQSQSSLNYYSDGYLKGAELNKGDQLNFTKKNGTNIRIKLLETDAFQILHFPGYDSLKGWQDGMVFCMTALWEINGLPFQTIKYIPTQQSFAEPYVIDGVSIFFDAVKDIEKLMKDNHGSSGTRSFPKKDVRIALQEYDLDACPEGIGVWLPGFRKPDITQCYHGGDCWLGPYRTNECHNGLDINVLNYTSVFAPISLDDQYYHQSVKAGDNNNRWMGIRKWNDSLTWIIRTHHLNRLLVEEKTPLQKGKMYAQGGGVYFGNHPHLHFYFSMIQGKDEIALDPWILFWYSLRNQNKAEGKLIPAIKIHQKSLVAEEKYTFEAELFSGNKQADSLFFIWYAANNVEKIGRQISLSFDKPGIYPIKLGASNFSDTVWTIQYLTVSGKSKERSQNLPEKLYSYHRVDESEFRMPSYLYLNKKSLGKDTLSIVFPEYDSKLISDIKITYYQDTAWLSDFDQQFKEVRFHVIPSKIGNAAGINLAEISFLNKRNEIIATRLVQVYNSGYVQLKDEVIIDDKDAQKLPSPYFWISPPYVYDWSKGYNGRYSVWAGDSLGISGKMVFRPDVMQGKYEIKPYTKEMRLQDFPCKDCGFYIRINHEGGSEKKWVNRNDNSWGVYELKGSKISSVEVLTENAKGNILIDGIQFEKIP